MDLELRWYRRKVDWCLESSNPRAARELRREFVAYLERHAEPGSDIDAAELAFRELLANAIEHAQGFVWVSVEWGGERPVLTVHDLGPGFQPRDQVTPDPMAEGGRGLWLVAHLTDDLEVASKRAGGARVTAVLPVRRPPEPSYDRPRRKQPSLPAPEEASEDGTFAREPFLLSLVVQLAQAIELQDGPAAAEAAITQVGTDVGGRMEEEYRRARSVTERLTPTQMADLYVRLKRAIDGDFYVIEADEERIILGNRRCPFGSAVTRAPTLCRMTSSVFGAIAARNGGESAVVLEERIAVGDPGCRVVVWLQEPPREVAGQAHRYRPPE